MPMTSESNVLAARLLCMSLHVHNRDIKFTKEFWLSFVNHSIMAFIDPPEDDEEANALAKTVGVNGEVCYYDDTITPNVILSDDAVEVLSAKYDWIIYTMKQNLPASSTVCGQLLQEVYSKHIKTQSKL